MGTVTLTIMPPGGIPLTLDVGAALNLMRQLRLFF